VDWRIKGLIQKVLSHVPAGRHLNNALQQRLGGLKGFDSNVDIKVKNDWWVLVSHMRELAIPIEGRTFLEIGTGWYPTLPVCFFLGGAARCVSYDLTRLLDFDLTRRMLLRLEQHLAPSAERLGVSETLVRERWERLRAARDAADFLQRAGIEYRAPADAAATQLPAGSIDVVFSNSVLEHVEPNAIEALMRETRRLLRPGGVAIHSVNCGDHYAYFDRGITPVHYLRYSEAHWRLWNNDLQYQNRLRADDFIESARRAGLAIVLNHQRPRRELIERFDQLPIAAEFRRYSREQLCTTSVDFVAAAPA
jgi:SAM-dependent methyltransferase